MVKKFLLITITALLLSSCAFFGASMFSTATSEELYWFVNSGYISDFYILDNGDPDDEPLLILVNKDGPTKVLVLDTSLNIRGFMEDEVDGVSTDGVGFVDHNGDYVIGQTKIGRNGSTDPADISFVNVTDRGGDPYDDTNLFITRYHDSISSTDYYLKVSKTSNSNDPPPYYITNDNADWGVIPAPSSISLPFEFQMIMKQSDLSLSDVVVIEGDPSSGPINIYPVEKAAIFNHATSTPVITLPVPITVDNNSLTQWVTRCSKGYFVSTYDSYLLYNDAGALIETINYRHGNKEIATIDHNCEFYYVVDRNEGIIRKERVPF